MGWISFGMTKRFGLLGFGNWDTFWGLPLGQPVVATTCRRGGTTPKPRDLVIVRKALDRIADLESAMVKLHNRRERLQVQADALAPALSA